MKTIEQKEVFKNKTITLSREEYAVLLNLKKIREFIPNFKEKNALRRAESDFKNKKTMSYGQLVKELGLTD